MSILKKLVRSYESGAPILFSEYLKKAKAFGVSTKYFATEFCNDALDYLKSKTFKSHRSRSSNDDLHEKYYKFELARKRHINACYNLNWSDDRVQRELHFYQNMPNPFILFKCMKRGRSVPDFESIDEDYGIDYEIERRYL